MIFNVPPRCPSDFSDRTSGVRLKNINAGVMELADVTDSKSVGLITRVGSSPTTGTTKLPKLYGFGSFSCSGSGEGWQKFLCSMVFRERFDTRFPHGFQYSAILTNNMAIGCSIVQIAPRNAKGDLKGRLNGCVIHYNTLYVVL